MLKITLHHETGEPAFRLEGKLGGLWVEELRRCWASVPAGSRVVVDLREVDFVDPAGEALLAEMRRAGAKLRACTPVIQAVVREVSRAPRCGRVEEKASPRRDDVPGS